MEFLDWNADMIVCKWCGECFFADPLPQTATTVAHLCYGKTKPFGAIYYGAGGRHFATMRVDRSAVVPGEWWVAQAEVPTPPYIAGLITYTVKINGHKIKLTLGEIGTREKDDGRATQYYGQFVSIPPKECKFLRIELDDA